MYQYTVVYKNQETGAYYTPSFVAFTKRDLNAQIMRKRPDGFRYVRTVQTVPGLYTDLQPAMPDMILTEGKPTTAWPKGERKFAFSFFIS